MTGVFTELHALCLCEDSSKSSTYPRKVLGPLVAVRLSSSFTPTTESTISYVFGLPLQHVKKPARTACKKAFSYLYSVVERTSLVTVRIINYVFTSRIMLVALYRSTVLLSSSLECA